MNPKEGKSCLNSYENLQSDTCLTYALAATVSGRKLDYADAWYGLIERQFVQVDLAYSLRLHG
ncbi:hypothetical protein GCM10027347_41100 [Larkinella harenae]